MTTPHRPFWRRLAQAAVSTGAASEPAATGRAGLVSTMRPLALEQRFMFDAAGGGEAAHAITDSAAPVDAAADPTSALRHALMAEPAAPTNPRQEVVFVDGRVADYQQLIHGLQPGVDVLVLDISRDGLEQITEYLAGRTGIDAVHVLSHGSQGQISLGASTLDTASIAGHASALAAIGSHLSEAGDILFYGCDVARGNGVQLIEQIARLSGADVAASTDATGSATRGGNWLLEASTGAIEAASPWQASSGPDYDHLLATVTLNNYWLNNSTDDWGYSDNQTGGNLEQAFDSIHFNVDGTAFGTPPVEFTIYSISRTPFNLESLKVRPLDGNDYQLEIYPTGNYAAKVTSPLISGRETQTIVILTPLLNITSFTVRFVDVVPGRDMDEGAPVYLDFLSFATSPASTPNPPPTLVSATFADNALKVGETSQVTFVFNTAVSGFGTEDLTVPNGQITGLTSVDGGTTWTGIFTPSAGVTVATNVITVDMNGVRSVSGDIIGSGFANSINYAIDTQAPTVSGVSATTANGHYVVGQTVDITITFNESVTVTGTPQLTLETGSSDRVVNYLSGSGTNTLTFRYTIQAGDTSLDLDYVSSSALALNGGSIRDSAGNDATLTLAVPGAAGSLGANKAIVIDSAPTIGNLNGDSVAWAGVGNTVMLDLGANATLLDAELGALYGGNGDWRGASLTVQRRGAVVSADLLGFDTAGALFTISGSNLQAGGLTFATFTSTGGVLTVTFTSSGTTATTALAQDVLQRITYRNDTPAGDATMRFSLSDGYSITTADVTVASDVIYITNTTDTAVIDVSNGVSISEAVAIAAADSTGSQTLIFTSSFGTTVSLIGNLAINESLTFNADAALGLVISSGSKITLGTGTTLTWTNSAGMTIIGTTLAGNGSLLKMGNGTLALGSVGNEANMSGNITVTAGTLQIASDNHLSSGMLTLNGGTLSNSGVAMTIDNAITLGAGGATFDIDGSSGAGTLVLSGVVSGAGGLTKTGQGSLELRRGNTYSGTTNVLGGVLSIASDSNLGTGAVMLATGSTLRVTGTTTIDNAIAFSGNATVDGLAGVTLSGGLSGTGSLNKTGGGTLVLSNTNNWANMSGGISVTGGTLSVAEQKALSSGALTIDGGTLQATASVTLSNNIVIGSAGGIVDIGIGTGTGTIQLDGHVSGSGTITKIGSGSLHFRTANDFSGGLNVNEGFVAALNTGSALGTGQIKLAGGTRLGFAQMSAGVVTNNIQLAGNATILNGAAANSHVTLSGVISETGGSQNLTLDVNSGTNSSITVAGANTYTGTTTIDRGLVRITDSSNISTGTVTLNGTNTVLQVTGSGITLNNYIFASSGATIHNDHAVTFAGSLSGLGTLTKAGLGTLILSGTSAHSGKIAVSAGTLLVNGALSANTGLDVAAGATLGGHGSIFASNSTHSLSIKSGGTLSPGNNGVGTLTIHGNLMMASGSTLAVDINGSTAGSGYDQVIVNGTVSVSGAMLAASHSYTASNGDTYRIIDNDAADTTTGSFSGMAEGGRLTAAGNGTVMTASYIGGDGNDFTLTALVAPVVTGVSSSTANGLYKIGDVLTITVTFDTTVWVTGMPQLQLETGTTDRWLDYVAGSGSNTLTFSYIVQAGDSSADLDYVSSSALVLNGGSIRSGANTDALLNLANPGAAGSLGANKALVIDGVRPTASIVLSDTALRLGETSTVTITFNEAVTGLTTADFQVAHGALSGLSSADGGVTWTATFTPSSYVEDSSNVITLDNTGVQDRAGNTGSGSTKSSNFAIDTLRPSATISLANTLLAAGETTTVTITFNEAVLGLSTADFTVSHGSLSGLTSSDGGITWTAVFTPDAHVDVSSNVITLNQAGVTDVAGNAGIGNVNSSAYVVDTIAPVTVSMALAPTTLNAQQTAVLTVRFSEAVHGLDVADFTVAHGTLSDLRSADGGITWTAVFTPNAGVTSALNLITLNNAGVSDWAGNAGSGVTHSGNYAIDTERPTATIVMADSSLIAGQTSQVTITFSEAVTGLTTADFTVAHGTLTDLRSADGGITWTAVFTPDAGITNALNLITLNNAGVSDWAGNAGSGVTHSGNYAIDTERPTATIVIADSSLIAGQTSQVTITFSEAVTGLTTADFTVAHGTLSDLRSADGGITWTAVFTPNAGVSGAANVITLNNSGVQDGAGNTGVGATSSNSYAIDTALPAQPELQVQSNLEGRAVLRVDALEPGAQWEYSLDGGQTWQLGQGQVVNIDRPGLYLVQVRQTDAAGNVSEPAVLSVEVAPMLVPPRLEWPQMSWLHGADPAAAAAVPLGMAAMEPPSEAAMTQGLGGLGGLGGRWAMNPGVFLSGDNALFRAGVITESDELSGGYLGAGGLPGSAHLSALFGSQGGAPNRLVLLEPVEAVQATANRQVDWRVSPTMFGRADPLAVVQYSMSLANGQPLPAWLKFDPQTGHVSGVLPIGFKGELVLRLTARDSHGNLVSTDIKLKPAAAQAPARAGVGEQLQRHSQVRTGLATAQRLQM